VALSTDEPVLDRGPIRSAGFDRYSAWIENGPLPRRRFDDRRDIYGAVSYWDAPLLRAAGVCSTVRIGAITLGTDKLDHFFEEGYNGWRRAEFGATPEEAIRWATHTELGIYGLKSSETFSYADLRADWDGYTFYDTLLGPQSVVQRGSDGCLARTGDFDWSRYVTWEYDEVMNPSVYTPETQDGINLRLTEVSGRMCDGYRVWGGVDYQRHLAGVLGQRPAYASDEAPRRYDPFQLADLCDGDGWVTAPVSSLLDDRLDAVAED